MGQGRDRGQYLKCEQRENKAPGGKDRTGSLLEEVTKKLPALW